MILAGLLEELVIPCRSLPGVLDQRFLVGVKLWNCEDARSMFFSQLVAAGSFLLVPYAICFDYFVYTEMGIHVHEHNNIRCLRLTLNYVNCSEAFLLLANECKDSLNERKYIARGLAEDQSIHNYGDCELTGY